VNKITLHAQGYEGWLDDYATVSRARWMKFVNWFPTMSGVSIIGRVHVPEADQDTMIAAGATGADAFFSRVYPEMVKARHVVLWEGPNEPSIWKLNVLAGFRPFYQRLIHLYHANGFRICAGSINTGWPFLPKDDGGNQSAIVGQAVQGADAVGFHEYDPVDLRANPGYLALRYRVTTSYWRSLGLAVPPVFITELGLDKPGGPCFGHWGWRTILKGDLQAYIDQLLWYRQQINEDGYVEAATVFGVVTNWTEFLLDQAQAMTLARALAVPEPGPEPGGPMRIYDIDGNEQDWAWVQKEFGAVSVALAPDGPAWRVVELREADGYAAILVRGPEGRRVARWWPGEHPALPAELATWQANGVWCAIKPEGHCDFGMGSGDYYFPPAGGASWYWMEGASDCCQGWGMIGGTPHRHLDITFAWQDEPQPNQPPVAVPRATVNGMKVALDGSGSHDPDGSIVQYRWNPGDGTGALWGKTRIHEYAEPGTYKVTLRVKDDDGATGFGSLKVTVPGGDCEQALALIEAARVKIERSMGLQAEALADLDKAQEILESM